MTQKLILIALVAALPYTMAKGQDAGMADIPMIELLQQMSDELMLEP